MQDNWASNIDSQSQDEDEVFVENTQEGVDANPGANAGANVGANAGTKGTRKRSKYWDIFTEEKHEIEGVKVRFGRCNNCGTLIKSDPRKNGTSALIKHASICKNNPENLEKQTTIQFKKGVNGEASVGAWKHDEKRIKRAITNMFVVGELSFKFIENEAFIEYTNALNGRVHVPSRTTIARNVVAWYLEERNKLATFLSNSKITVHFTTDAWTSSCQRVSYMVVTAHFIDEAWEMHKLIIYFKPLDSHRGGDIGEALLKCIQEWGIKNLMTITVDNASANDKAVKYLTTRLDLYDNGDHFHIRAHILNLIVKDGLNEHDSSVTCLQKAVRYIRNSTPRIERFKEYMRELGMGHMKFLCNDCPTRWNSTYDLLKQAVDLENVFYKYALEDKSLKNHLRPPVREDFAICKSMFQFLEKFKIKTDIVSASTKPVAHRFIGEICDVSTHIDKWSAHPKFCLMGVEMRNKYDKYWGSIDKLNDYMYFAVLLDPRLKFPFLKHTFEKFLKPTSHDGTPLPRYQIPMVVNPIIRDIEKRGNKLFETYKEKFEDVETQPSSQNQSKEDAIHIDDDNDFMNDFLGQADDMVSSTDSEWKRYLDETPTPPTKDFDILTWWKQNASRYPVVSRMAKDILAIQISTVASESAFSTSGRILDPYRTSLSPPILEALMCLQDWVQKSRKPIVDNIDEILNDDELAKELEEALKIGKGKEHVTNQIDID